MAANMKSVKLRIKSIQNTMQITKAMELVASSKLRRAKEKAEHTKPYFRTLRKTLSEIANGNTDFSSPYTKENASDKWCYVLIAGDRGMAGGYNANLFRALEEEVKGKDFVLFPLGKKALEYGKQKHYSIVNDHYSSVGEFAVSDAYAVGKELCKAYREGSYGHVVFVYTDFISMMSQKVGSLSLLPLSDLKEETAEEAKAIRNLILYEPSGEDVFNAIVPEYLAGLVYSGICTSVVSELAARRTAMEAATDNAGEMIDKLSLFYNRARQASITQEITEIVAGAEEL